MQGTVISCMEIHFNEDTETIDAYVMWEIQVAGMLNYNASNTLPSHLHWLLFPIENLTVERAKRIQTEETLDRQLAGQSVGASPFFMIEEKKPGQKMLVYNKSNMIGAKIDKVTCMTGNYPPNTSQPSHSHLEYTGGSRLSRTVVKLDSCLARIFFAKFLCKIKLIIIIG